MIRSSIDLGTNTCLLLILDKEDRIVADLAKVVRLGEKVDKTGVLAPQAMERAMTCLKEYATALKKNGGDPKDTICVSTASARDAANGKEFFEKVNHETGFRFQVVSGQEEAKLAFLGTLLPQEDPSGKLVMDIGGGSTEFTTLSDRVSLQMGSVRFTERFLKSDPVTDSEFWKCQEEIDSALNGALPIKNAGVKEFIAVAGTATTLAQVHLALPGFDRKKIDETILTRGDLHRLVEDLKFRNVSERKLMIGMEPDRADVLLAGALIFWRAMEKLDLKNARISTRGLRFGLLKSISN